MDVVNIQNVRSVDRFMATPSVPIAERIHAMGHDSARAFLRSFAADQNRWYIDQWEWTQLGTGLALLLLLVFGTRPPKIAIGLCLLMLVIVLIERFGLTPFLDRLGPQPDLPPSRSFTTLRTTYSIMEMVKVLLGLGMAGLLLLKKPADPRMFARESEVEEAVTPRRSPK
jgi:hypothetical protein